jgi:hypothetical protein
MKNLFIFAVCLLLVASAVSAEKPVNMTVTPGSGSIWTTNGDCGTESQDVNEYNLGEKVYINGDKFEAGDYDWTITGQPGQASCDPNAIVASGTKTVDSSGAFCFDAYIVANDDCGVYSVDFGKKNDNYHVIPEFGIFAGVLTLVCAVGVFFMIRRK